MIVNVAFSAFELLNITRITSLGGIQHKLELSRAHTPCAASASAAGAALIYMYVFVDDHYLHMLGQLCA